MWWNSHGVRGRSLLRLDVRLGLGQDVGLGVERGWADRGRAGRLVCSECRPMSLCAMAGQKGVGGSLRVR